MSTVESLNDLWKCEYGLLNHKQCTNEFIKKQLFTLNVCYSTIFEPTQRASCMDAALDVVESRFLLFGNSDGLLILYDTRFPQKNAVGELVFPKIASVDSVPNSLLPLGGPTHLSPTVCLQWSPVDSGAFFTASLDKTLKIWDTNRLECVDMIETPEAITSLALSTFAVEHNLIALGLTHSTERQAVLVDPLVGSPTLSFRGGHVGRTVTGVLWSQRSSFLVNTTGDDGRILFWDIRLPTKPIASLNNLATADSTAYSPEAVAHNGAVVSLAHTRDSLHLLSLGWTGPQGNMSLRMWPLTAQGQPSAAGPSANLMVPIRVPPDRSVGVNLFGVRIAVIEAPGSGFIGSRHHDVVVFFPVASSVAVFSVCCIDANISRLLNRHFAKVRVCVWNDTRRELYTSGLDSNILVWPLFPVSTDYGQSGGTEAFPTASVSD